MAPTPTDKPTPQASATNQLGALPFGSLIGGPLNAAIEAQAQAALSSVDFIQKVGLTEDGAVQNVKFKYVDSTSKDVTLEVPLLTIVPVPFIRIDDMTIDFKANISAATEVEDKVTKSTEKKAEIEAGGRYLFVKASLNASVSSKRDSTSTKGSKYSVEYTMDVHVHAVQDDMPKGLATVLNLLHETIMAKPA